MSAEALPPECWLAQAPLAPHERLYLILSDASAARPLSALRRIGHPLAPLPAWRETPYADWFEVMPHVVELTARSPFLSWIAETECRDWGWLAVSSNTPEQLVAHLRGLTQVKLPTGKPVFFRCWDGRQWLPTLDFLGTEAGELLPGVSRYLINGQARTLAQPVKREARTYPWWEVPSALLEHLSVACPQTLIENSLQWLNEDHPALYDALPVPHLRHKIARFLERAAPGPARQDALLVYLRGELAVAAPFAREANR
ncbi:DUF4123 domain-containing protein [Pseudomonas sp. FEN]|uniref:DUF4123 domain-containing protein n=1 Tax=Pseudomonas sp. FEN TaxID=2767468 RepID=UPI00174853BA|nr:DUF4123 domain-containing protein [Pseudomonas sp. FEN]